MVVGVVAVLPSIVSVVVDGVVLVVVVLPSVYYIKYSNT